MRRETPLAMKGLSESIPGAGLRGLSLRSVALRDTLKKDGQLRGCIGTFAPTQTTLAAEIIRNAVLAATEDPRFEPLREDELPTLQVSVDVLSEPEKVENEAQLDPKEYGVIVQQGHRRGLLLPDLEGVDTVEEQLHIAKRKAGIADTAAVDLFRFRVRRYGV